MSPLTSHYGDILVVEGLSTCDKGFCKDEKNSTEHLVTMWGLFYSPGPGTVRSFSLAEGLLTWAFSLPESWYPFSLLSETELLPVCLVLVWSQVS